MKYCKTLHETVQKSLLCRKIHLKIKILDSNFYIFIKNIVLFKKKQKNIQVFKKRVNLLSTTENYIVKNK